MVFAITARFVALANKASEGGFDGETDRRAVDTISRIEKLTGFARSL